MEEYYEDDFEDEEPTPPPTPDSVPPQDAAAAVTPIAVPASEPVDASACSRSPTDMRFPWQLVSLEELDLSERLAAGAMGAVHAGTFRGRPVAVKTLHDASSAALAAVEAELLVHASIKHERIVELCGANLFPPGCCIVMERCECSLFEKLHRRADELTRRQSMDIARQVAEGMRHLHSRRPPIVHRDLKSHNVLLDVRGDAKLCDFGLVGTKEVTAGTPNYMAPELFLAKVRVPLFAAVLRETSAAACHCLCLRLRLRFPCLPWPTVPLLSIFIPTRAALLDLCRRLRLRSAAQRTVGARGAVGRLPAIGHPTQGDRRRAAAHTTNDAVFMRDAPQKAMARHASKPPHL